MAIKVAKFGGSSLSDANQFRKVKNIAITKMIGYFTYIHICALKKFECIV